MMIVPSVVPVTGTQGTNTSIIVGGRPEVALSTFRYGGVIINPATTEDQNLPNLEVLYVDPTARATPYESATTVAIQPGQSFNVPPGQTTLTWVNAVTGGHTFVAIGYAASAPFSPTPIPSDFPPSGPTTMTGIIPSYLYEEYDDDSDLQAFVASYNTLAQTFLNTVNSLNLPIYTSPEIEGSLLDWVAQGLYGIARPALSSGRTSLVGPLDTYEFNTMEFNDIDLVSPTDIVATSDDTFKRILTWLFFKGDGKVFSIRWLKRRIMRFLIGVDGTNPNVADTSQISVTFGTDGEVAIRFVDSVTEIVGNHNALYDACEFNEARFNEINVEITPLTPLPYRAIFQEAVQTGVLELPFQFVFNVII